jgi:hypothetical protein
MPTRKSRKRVRERPASLIQRDVKLLKEWASNDTEIELVAHVGAASLMHLGRVVELGWSNQIDDFMFIANSGLRVLLTPAIWRQSSLESLTSRSLHVLDYEGSRSSLTVREVVRPKKNTPNGSMIREQFRAWAKLNAELGVQLTSGRHAMFFLGFVAELSNGAFSFIQVARAIQLMLVLDDFNYMEIGHRNAKVVIDLGKHSHRRAISDIGRDIAGGNVCEIQSGELVGSVD